ncbi:hypothetical protein SISNIDRAFT_296623 [Sistotremastrum niveocremeum HHB9708]|uniref:Uncharacterized protein n=2 Tax=Sistotremastraceae TaxID=3402574 RepID=A0A164NLB1_9AGAM|nr:hypothetical protein SISNIDRAFT_296623 [Sistotremastrum niveocremeum HHB9708]KZT41953.1 hypothetical protein SISSUDRAFT_181007 [Sistotremastrum suecicum HHB10207 ss-3]
MCSHGSLLGALVTSIRLAFYLFIRARLVDDERHQSLFSMLSTSSIGCATAFLFVPIATVLALFSSRCEVLRRRIYRGDLPGGTSFGHTCQLHHLGVPFFLRKKRHRFWKICQRSRQTASIAMHSAFRLRLRTFL